MKDEIRSNPEADSSGVEQLLKNKINELSESIDCFDKISARAFPENSEEFTDDEFTVTGLENITGKPQHFRFVKWISVTAAAAILIAVVPQTDFARQFMANLGSCSTERVYQDILSEINTISTEFGNDDYITVDMPLDYYISNDVLITPLFSCPFKDYGVENAGVRLYIRQIDGINTTQLYAVEYIGTYSEDNIIAVAESDFKFTQNDIEQLRDNSSNGQYSMTGYSDIAVSQFSDKDETGLLTDNNGEYVSVASFCDFSIIKDNNVLHTVTSEILYGHKTNDDLYFYDIISESDGKILNMPERRNMWRRSVYFNGNSAMPEENISKFTKTELFDISVASENTYPDCTYIYPYNSDDSIKWNYDEIISISESYSGKRLSGMILPNYETMHSCLSTVKMYFSQSNFFENNHERILNLNLKNQSNKILKAFSISISDIIEDSDIISEDMRWYEIQEMIDKEARRIQEQVYQQNILAEEQEEQNAIENRSEYELEYD